MQIISLNVGLPQEVSWKGRTVSTGIFKSPVEERIEMRILNLNGDAQADLTVHGGVEKAVYAYPSEHYPYWQQQLPEADLPWGAFGENLTTTGLLEPEVNIGDRFRIGTTEVMVTQPRFPCFKLNLKFNRDDMLKRFLGSGLSGIYFSVIKEGDIGVGDTFTLTHRDEHNVTVSDVVKIYRHEADLAAVRKAIAVPALAADLRQRFQQQLPD
ncbi:MAG: MOSC domain-containing protein [Phormidesmis priestleyi]|uniref:MOSC domain-containing protein n=1 Tax=Phormidesmis priestleyi TaxID=268141 RepID=A0A2W4WUS1_9CYAN|nr:MAG: MOSC domain-containing protein [Phormidesmis priestleyi]